MNEKKHELESLLGFMKASPTAFHAVDEIERRLLSRGFLSLREGWESELVPGGKYYLTRGRSSIIAFCVPSECPIGALISATHTDSPAFRLKVNYESEAFGKYLRFSTEKYGGMIHSTWLDRPLSVAGRAVVREGARLVAKSVMLDRDLLLIPSVAIHLNRSVNEGKALNPATDLLPLAGAASEKGALRRMLADALSVPEDEVVSCELSVYDRTPGTIWGLGEEFFSSSRIDNLECTYATLSGFLTASPKPDELIVFSAFDSEEVGSATRMGADSDFLRSVLTQITSSFGVSLSSILPSSMLISADNAHARHPNHPELSDAQNAPDMNGGVVIKMNAQRRYATDALSAAAFGEICARAGVPVQHFASRSDLPCGSTLGAISGTQLPIPTVDIGLAQLAMHSAYETAGCADLDYMIRAMRAFFSSRLSSRADGELLADF